MLSLIDEICIAIWLDRTILTTAVGPLSFKQDEPLHWSRPIRFLRSNLFVMLLRILLIAYPCAVDGRCKDCYVPCLALEVTFFFDL